MDRWRWRFFFSWLLFDRMRGWRLFWQGSLKIARGLGRTKTDVRRPLGVLPAGLPVKGAEAALPLGPKYFRRPFLWDRHGPGMKSWKERKQSGIRFPPSSHSNLLFHHCGPGFWDPNF
ncbi:hypothetical protein B0J18DRAFT_220013 [Chaetomium sp. MPI-SDFR-AT-0129]|nr:hypothetical protein B0J18DRAFT_220013 [Chaetomium sp. MPI-SDFR-AT-0129]